MLVEGKVARFGWLLPAFPCASAVHAQNRTAAMPLLKNRVDPKEFGIQDDTITVVSATSFVPWTSSIGIGYSPNFGLACDPNNHMHYYANLNLPADAVIDNIGFNSATDTDAVLGVALWFRNSIGGTVLEAGFSSPAHDWGTDYSGPIHVPVGDHEGHEWVIDVENAPNRNLQYFAWVEVWWHKTVSDPPPTPSFNDVPTSHPFFQFIEALKTSGTTGGCGGGNYCPDNPVTRGQMAVFLAKALGLHWPD